MRWSLRGRSDSQGGVAAESAFLGCRDLPLPRQGLVAVAHPHGAVAHPHGAGGHPHGAAGRQGAPCSLPTGPSLLWTWRPSGSRYFAYQTAPRASSTVKAYPNGRLRSMLMAQILRLLREISGKRLLLRIIPKLSKATIYGTFPEPTRGLEPRTPSLRVNRPRTSATSADCLEVYEKWRGCRQVLVTSIWARVAT